MSLLHRRRSEIAPSTDGRDTAGTVREEGREERRERLSRAERRELRARAAAEADLEARVARARRRLAQAGGLPEQRGSAGS